MSTKRGRGAALEGMVFAITGTLSMKRAEFVSLIEANGGVVKGSVTRDVTHLISAKDNSEKANKAKETGVKILKEAQVIKMMGGKKKVAQKKEEIEEAKPKPAPGGSLEGMIFAITGTLSMKRDQFVSLIEENGGLVKGSVTKEVTHLISARDDTTKAQKAKANGVTILKEEQVMDMINGGGKKAAAKEEEEDEEDEEEADGEEEAASGSSLDGMVFAITGALSMKRADFVSLIEENGGVVKGSVTKDVTHLISARADTAKAKKAKESGVEILKEEQVMEMVKGGGGKPAATNDGTGPVLHLFEPCSSIELANKSSSTGWHWGDDESLCEERQHSGMATAPAKARKLAADLHKVLDKVTLPASESDTEAIVVVISNVPALQNVSADERNKVFQAACFDALAVKERVRDQATCESLKFNEKRDIGFCYDDPPEDEEEEEDDNRGAILKATGILADTFGDGGFEFNFSDEVVTAPVVYGGLYDDNCIVGVLSMRVWT